MLEQKKKKMKKKNSRMRYYTLLRKDIMILRNILEKKENEKEELSNALLYSVEEGYYDIAEYLGQFVTRLDLKDCNMTDQMLQCLHCPKLQILDIQNCGNVNDETLETLSCQCNKLEQIVIGKCDNLSDEGVKALARNCPQLTHLDLRHNDR